MHWLIFKRVDREQEVAKVIESREKRKKINEETVSFNSSWNSLTAIRVAYAGSNQFADGSTLTPKSESRGRGNRERRARVTPRKALRRRKISVAKVKRPYEATNERGDHRQRVPPRYESAIFSRSSQHINSRAAAPPTRVRLLIAHTIRYGNTVRCA